ncbi:MAG: methylmalonyl-CoA mutase family protein, partial [Candidatus Nanopelagicales bacterium]|nr:methylmalonyl-CoA mutase family protein [Candidatus Nanopelagicales bacterium]
TAIEALAGVFGGTNSLHTNALDEVLALPSAEAAEIALRTQQVVLEETGVANVADPLGGSWYVEALTDTIEDEAEKLFAQIEQLGGGSAADSMTRGILRGIEDGWFTDRIADSAFEYQRALERGDKHQVGVTVHTDSIEKPLEILRVSHEVETEQVSALASRRARRDSLLVESALTELSAAAKGSSNLIPFLMNAARAEATLGEICDVLRDEWGEYREPARI